MLQRRVLTLVGDHQNLSQSDHTEATLMISTYFGGLNGTGDRAVVRKFGADWVVVSLAQAYVS